MRCRFFRKVSFRMFWVPQMYIFTLQFLEISDLDTRVPQILRLWSVLLYTTRSASTLSAFLIPGMFHVCQYLVTSKSFIYQQMHFISVLENIKLYIKTYIKIAPTCFGLRPSSGSLHMSLAKVCCAEFHAAQHTVHTPPWTWYNMLPHNRIVHNDVLLPI